MKALLSLLVATTLVAAQGIPSSWPSCAKSCLEAAISKANCDGSAVQCLCSANINPNTGLTLDDCLLGQCNANEILELDSDIANACTGTGSQTTDAAATSFSTEAPVTTTALESSTASSSNDETSTASSAASSASTASSSPSGQASASASETKKNSKSTASTTSGSNAADSTASNGSGSGSSGSGNGSGGGSGGLSTGAKAGIGVAVAFGVLGIIAFIAAFLLMRRRKAKTGDAAANTAGQEKENIPPSASVSPGRSEMDGGSKPLEMEAVVSQSSGGSRTPGVPELDGRARHELQA